MTTVTDYLDSVRISIESAIEELRAVQQSADETETVDFSGTLKSLRDAAGELRYVIELIG